MNIAGGMHHAMRTHASGFCIYNDAAIAISWLLDNGFDRIAYIDVDAHHGDGVQAQFWNDPRVLTVSIHEDPQHLWPNTGYPSELGGPEARGTAINIPVPAFCPDRLWLRAFHAVVPSVIREFRPQLIVSQCGCDSHGADPLTDLSLTVDGQRAAILAMRDLADEVCDGRWLAVGGGGYQLVGVVPRTWTHLIGAVVGVDVDPATPIPGEWKDLVAQLPAERIAVPGPAPETMGDGGDTRHVPWEPSTYDPAERSIEATADRFIARARSAVLPLHGLDPEDPVTDEVPLHPSGPATDPFPAPSVQAASAGPYEFPAHWVADVLASDGGVVHLRPVVPDDADAIVEFHAGLSERTRYLRYFGPYPVMPPRDVARMTTVDHEQRVCLLAVLGGRIIAVGLYEGLADAGKPTSAEVAFVVADEHQGRGLGPILLEHLAGAAAENGFHRFEAEVLAENRYMVNVFKAAGYELRRSFDGSVVHVEFGIDPTEALVAVRNARELASEARSVSNALRPTSIAVIGASATPARSGTRSCATSSPAISPVPCSRCTRSGGRSPESARTARSGTSPIRSTSPLSPCPPTTWTRCSTTAWPRTCARCWWCRRGSRTPAAGARSPSGGCSRRCARTGCG
ncbi:hypothetical protein MTP03_20330 [Tsukamurella sp. PLM1]|nr:hypothetical protein MTP03_20330 [Tsukamurella sp. PLM1]